MPRQNAGTIQFAAKKIKPTLTKTPAIKASKEDQKEAAKLFKKAEKLKKKYPGMNGIILVDEGEYTYRKDGTRITVSRYAGIILKEDLKKSWGRVVGYESEGRSRTKFIKASVYTPDGKIYPLDASKIKRTKPQAKEKFFSSGGEYMIYALPNVQVGCIIDYTIERETYNPYEKDFFFPTWNFQTSSPVSYSKIKITVPKERELYYKAINFNGKFSKFRKPKIRKNKETTSYQWELKNVPALIGEPMMPPHSDIAPRLKASLFKTWDEIFDWTNDLYQLRVKANEELKSFTFNLIKNCKNDEEKTAKIYHYVQKEIRYIAVKLGIASGMGGFDANLTWKRRWGCCVDKAVLFTAMLKVAGIESSPLLVMTNTSKKVDFSVAAIGFNHAISVVKLNGKKVFLDSTNSDFRFPAMASFDYGIEVLNVFNRSIDYIELPNPKDNGSFYNYRIDLQPNGDATMTEKMTYTGTREAQLKGYYRSVKKEDRRRVFQRMIKSVSPTAELVDYEVNNAEVIEKPFSMEIKYNVKDYTIKASDIIVFEIPSFEMSAQAIHEVALAKRKFPIQYSISMGKYYHYEINFPPNYELVSMPKDIKLKNKHAIFNSHCEKSEENKIICEITRERTSRFVSSKDYAAYKSFS
ncbi:MAG: DUF3857 domain-containing protein, partial [Elusimicrobiota bacterium]|nr:DUF3857 domain-containing protein [Elusimicrobiota bacterium]